MARKPTTYEPEIAPEPSNTEKLVQNSHDLAVHSSEILERFGDGMPFDQYRYEDKIRSHLSRSAEEMLAAGRALVVAKEHISHGQWVDFLSKVGLEPRVAQRMAQAAIKFSNASTSSHLIEAAGGKSKLFELMVLDDDDLAELNEGGTVAGLELDDIAKMSVSELRRSLREARENAEARAKVLSDKNSKIDALDAELTKLKSKPPLVETLPPDEMAQKLSEEVARHAASVLGEINRCLLPALRALDEHDQANGTRHNVMSAGLVAQIETRLAELRADFDLPRHLDGDATPDWLRDDAEEVIQKAIENAGGTVQ